MTKQDNISAGRRIAVIEDDPSMNTVLTTVVRAHGCEALPFVSGDAFLAWFGSDGRYCDLIITDVHMPGASGLDVCRAVRGAKPPRPIPIILISGDDAESERAAGIAAGADDFIQKPFQRKSLLAMIDELFARS